MRRKRKRGEVIRRKEKEEEEKRREGSRREEKKSKTREERLLPCSPATKCNGRFIGRARAATTPCDGLKVRSSALRSGCLAPKRREVGADASVFIPGLSSSISRYLIEFNKN